MVFQNGDFRFFWNENIRDFATLPSAWDSILNTGLGQSQIGSLWITSYLNLTSLASKLGISWEWIQLLFWVLPAVLISFLSALSIFNYLFKEKVKYSLLAGFIYSFNTYFLMVLTGGQLGVALSYSIAPLVLLSFIKLVDNLSSQSYNFKFQISNFKLPIMAGLTLGLQIIFDPRIVYITLITTFLYSVFNFSDFKRVLSSSLGFFVLPLLVAVLMNIFWLLPLLLTKSTPLPQGLGSAHDFKFFSFADFSHAFSLLHPNWPENIFGKVYFLQPEFLILPILAYGSLIFISNIKNQKSKIHISFFVLLGLLGAFLAKGANPPFGEVNVWLFQNFPGMVMFRDPTKWYLLVALSYSILIPNGLSKLSGWFQSRMKTSNLKSQISNIFLLFTILYLLFLIHPAIGQIFKPREIPRDYVALKDLLNSDKEFARTLWIPGWQRYGFFSNNHPAIGREEVLSGNIDEQLKQLQENDAQETLKNFSIKYVIVPFDSEGEIFLTDRKYDEKKFENTVAEVEKVEWLKRLLGFEHMAVFEIKNPRDHFWSPSRQLSVDYRLKDLTEYEVIIVNARKGDRIIFSEGFDRNWKAQGSEALVSSEPYGGKLNSFLMPKDGVYKVYYEAQRWVNLGLLLSAATILSSLTFLLFGSKFKK